MKNKELTEAEIQSLHDGYDSLLHWIKHNNLDARDTMGLLMKAFTSLAVFNEIPKQELFVVVGAIYEFERASQPHHDEVH
jgi:hypothetical protein